MYAATWMNLRNIMLSKRNLTHNHIRYDPIYNEITKKENI